MSRRSLAGLLADALEDLVEVWIEDPLEEVAEELIGPFLRKGPAAKPSNKRKGAFDAVLSELELPPSWGSAPVEAELARRRVELVQGRARGRDRVLVRTRLSVVLPASGVVMDRAGRPGGRVLGGKLDSAVIAGAADLDELAAVLQPGDVQGTLLRLVKDGCTVDLRRDQLLVGVPFDRKAWKTANGVQRVAALANALERHILWRWDGLADELGLHFDAEGPTLSGRRDDRPVRAWYDADTDSTWITVAVPPLPEGTRLVAARRGDRSVDLGDPILDPLLTIETGDSAALALRVSRDPVRGPLLDVLCSYPGSVVDRDRIRLVAPGLLQEGLRGAVLLALELGVAL